MSRAARRVAVLLGTRPEAIKLWAVVRALESKGERPSVWVTGQHRELLDPILRDLDLTPDADLAVMQKDQSLAGLSSRVLTSVDDLLRRDKPLLLVVQGDTTSVAMGALAAFYAGVTVAHVEAGLRTHVARNPFPEEMNRRLVGGLADLHFAPTTRARENLLREGVADDAIHVVGNTVVDALHHFRDDVLPRLAPDPDLDGLGRSGRALVLVTAHRRESFGPDLQQVVEGVRRIADAHAVDVVYPVHLNPNVDGPVRTALQGAPNVRLTAPLAYLRFLQLLLRARLVVTDSGGVQEEAAAMGVPVLVARRTSERMEAVEAGVAELVGPDADRIAATASLLLTDPAAHARRAAPSAVFGEGDSGRRIADLILRALD